MIPMKTLPQREKELQALLATAAGRKELEELECRYHASSGTVTPARTSVITSILVHERVHGLICRGTDASAIVRGGHWRAL
jgi:hypothetical protein